MTRELTLRDAVGVAPDVVFRELDGEAVILNLDTGIYFGLDPIGTRIWELIQEHAALQKVFDAMCIEYDAQADTLERDLLELVNELRAKGLVNASAQ
jgi:hypothetical protein